MYTRKLLQIDEVNSLLLATLREDEKNSCKFVANLTDTQYIYNILYTFCYIITAT